MVGHTNTGKTSLLRTLLRDPSFGEVAPNAGTTRSVTSATLFAGSLAVAEVFDSPGLEDPIALRAAIPAVGPGQPERLRAFLESPSAAGALAQEAKVIRLALGVDALLYVIDCREPELGRQRHELEILRLAERPIIPVLNFTTDPDADVAGWRRRLQELQLHSSVAFDTVLFDAAGEERLYTKLQAVLDTHFTAFATLIAARASEQAGLKAQGLALIARLLAVSSALGVPVSKGDPAACEAGALALRQAVLALENATAEALIAAYRHRFDDLQMEAFRADGAPWTLDLFASETWRQLGVTAGRGAATGAAFALGVEILIGGLSLGAMTTLGAGVGAAAGLLAQGWRHLLQGLRGEQTLVVETATLQILALRNLGLLQALEHRGHASLAAIHPDWQTGPRLAPGFEREVIASRRLPALDPALALDTWREPATVGVDSENWRVWLEACSGL